MDKPNNTRAASEHVAKAIQPRRKRRGKPMPPSRKAVVKGFFDKQ